MERQLLPHTRVHPFPLVLRPGLQLYLKRDDEAGGLTAAGKLRKYASLLPSLTAQGISHAAIIGSTNSNNLVGLAQLLLERGIRPVPFVLEGHHEGQNAFFLKLLVPQTDWVQVTRAAWPQVQQQAEAWQEAMRTQGHAPTVIPEGCWTPAALPGAMTLAADIHAHAQALGQAFAHVWMDAGTGMGAIGLALGWAAETAQPEPQLHVVPMAGSAAAFTERWMEACQWINQSTHLQNNMPIQLHFPSMAKAYGSISAGLLKAIVEMARTHGVLCDPIYNAKLFATCAAWLSAHPEVQGNVLLIQSGGSHVLPGYADKLEPYLAQ